MDKVKNFCDHSMILLEMAANQKPTRHFWTTPASFRVKGGFKSEETEGFLYLQDKYSKYEQKIFQPKLINNLFKFSAQDSDLEYLLWRSEKFPVFPDHL